jgi:NRPS condensation-like uncharacterized protein
MAWSDKIRVSLSDGITLLNIRAKRALASCNTNGVFWTAVTVSRVEQIVVTLKSEDPRSFNEIAFPRQVVLDELCPFASGTKAITG